MKMKNGELQSRFMTRGSLDASTSRNRLNAALQSEAMAEDSPEYADSLEYA